MIGLAFFALGADVTVDAVRGLAGAGGARLSAAGIVLAAATLAVMPGLSWAQRRGRSRAAIGERRGRLQADTSLHLLSALVRAGLVLNAVAGWTWGEACCDDCRA